MNYEVDQSVLRIRSSEDILEQLEAAEGILDRLEAIYEQQRFVRNVRRKMTVHNRSYGSERLAYRKKLQTCLMPERMERFFPENFGAERIRLLRLTHRAPQIQGRRCDFLDLELEIRALESLCLPARLLLPLPLCDAASLRLLSDLDAREDLSSAKKLDQINQLLGYDSPDGDRQPFLFAAAEREQDPAELLFGAASSPKNGRGAQLQAKHVLGAYAALSSQPSVSAASISGTSGRHAAEGGVLERDDRELKLFLEDAMEGGYALFLPQRLSSRGRKDLGGLSPEQMNSKLAAFGLSLTGLELRELLAALECVQARFPGLAEAMAAGRGEAGFLAALMAAVDGRISACYCAAAYCDFTAALRSRELLLDLSVPKLLKDFSMQDILALIAPRPLFLAEILPPEDARAAGAASGDAAGSTVSEREEEAAEEAMAAPLSDDPSAAAKRKSEAGGEGEDAPEHAAPSAILRRADAGGRGLCSEEEALRVRAYSPSRAELRKQVKNLRQVYASYGAEEALHCDEDLEPESALRL